MIQQIIGNSVQLIQLVWEKGVVIQGLDPDLYRADHCGAIIKKDMYFKTSGALSMAWEIDHIKPLDHGGSDELSNLQPLQWQNNRKKANEYPFWTCLVKASRSGNSYVIVE